MGTRGNTLPLNTTNYIISTKKTPTIMAKKRNTKKKPKVNEELRGFNIGINEFGEIRSNLNIDKLNDFLNKNVDDKKLRGLEDNEPLIEDTTDHDEDVLFNENIELDENV